MKPRAVAILALALALLAAPLAVDAQPVKKPVRVGILLLATPAASAFIVHFRAGLLELGYVEGQNVVLEYRAAEAESSVFRILLGNSWTRGWM